MVGIKQDKTEVAILDAAEQRRNLPGGDER